MIEIQLRKCAKGKALLAAAALACRAYAQEFELLPAPPMQVPLAVDSNAAMFWRDGKLHLYTSTGDPMISTLGSTLAPVTTRPVVLDRNTHIPMWIESVWQEPGGALFAWYHYEQLGVCPNSTLTVPAIGALISHDGGFSFTDLGLVVGAGEQPNCAALNGYFAGGHGDFAVIADRAGEYFYFLFGSYGGHLEGQGVAIARMAVGNLRNPAGAVWKYYQGAWAEPGIGGRATPVFPATATWAGAETDSFWGPSVHWNTYLERYVLLMNRSCCGTGWPQEGIYISMNASLADPAGWTAPKKVTGYGDWYPWVFGQGEPETSAEAGQRVRLFVRSHSEWEIVFRPAAPAPPVPDPVPPAAPEPAPPPDSPGPPPEEPPPTEAPGPPPEAAPPPDSPEPPPESPVPAEAPGPPPEEPASPPDSPEPPPEGPPAEPSAGTS